MLGRILHRCARGSSLLASKRVPSPASGLLQQRIQRRCVSDYENPLDDEVEITAENQFDTYFLGQCEANYRPMTPLSFLERNAKLYPTLPAYHYEDGSKRSWAEVYKRVKRFAYHLTYDCDIERKAVVSILAPNSPPIFEAHFSIMGAGAVIHAINYRLDARTIAFQLQHAKSKVLIVDTEFAPLAKKAIDLYDNEDEKPIIIDIVDPIYATASGDRHRCGEYSYEDMCTASGPLSSVFDDVDEFDGVESDSDDDGARRTVNDYLDKYENDDVDLSSGETLDYLDAPPSPGGEPGEEAHQHVDDFELLYPESEWDPISVCYTSGTTGNPKGVVSHHRGAYLNAVSNALEWDMGRFPRLLAVVPLFHCNGWCFPWTVALRTGEMILPRAVRGPVLFDLIERHRAEYVVGAPITMTTMLAYENKFKFSHAVKMMTAGSPPPPVVMQRFRDEIGIDVMSSYGLTEVFGPVTNHIPDPADPADPAASAVEGEGSGEGMGGWDMARCTRQVGDAMLGEVAVRDPETLQEVPPDGRTMGEVMMRGNLVMNGYLNNEAATSRAFKGGWFRSGDLAVNHGHGRFEIKDRSKDIIISGGENVASPEVEFRMLHHPALQEAAVVAMPDDRFGEVPCAFVTLRTEFRNQQPTEAEIIEWCRGEMAGFQRPKRIIILDDLPKTNTGKVKKNELREMLKSL